MIVSDLTKQMCLYAYQLCGLFETSIAHNAIWHHQLSVPQIHLITRYFRTHSHRRCRTCLCQTRKWCFHSVIPTKVWTPDWNFTLPCPFLLRFQLWFLTDVRYRFVWTSPWLVVIYVLVCFYLWCTGWAEHWAESLSLESTIRDSWSTWLDSDHFYSKNSSKYNVVIGRHSNREACCQDVERPHHLLCLHKVSYISSMTNVREVDSNYIEEHYTINGEENLLTSSCIVLTSSCVVLSQITSPIHQYLISIYPLDDASRLFCTEWQLPEGIHLIRHE